MKGIIVSQRIYKPGQYVHHIQARLALEETGAWRPAIITRIGMGTFSIKSADGITRAYNCIETDRMRDVYESGRVPDGREGRGMIIVAAHSVLIIPAADEGKLFPRQAPINSLVTYLEEGAAQWSPTTDGAWHLFSIEAL
jgi:hypothetical protein